LGDSSVLSFSAIGTTNAANSKLHSNTQVDSNLFSSLFSREVLLCSIFLSLVGNVLYSLGPHTGKWAVLISRVIVGFGSGVLTPIRAALAELTTKDQRTRFMAYCNAAQFVGLVLPGMIQTIELPLLSE